MISALCMSRRLRSLFAGERDGWVPRASVLTFVLFHASVTQSDDSGHACRQSRVVSYDDDRRAALLVDGEEELVNLRAGGGIEIAGGFIGEE